MSTPQSKTLFDLTSDALELHELLSSGLEDAELNKQVDEWLEKVKGQLSEKLDGYILVIRNLELIGQARIAEGKRITGLGQVNINHADRLYDRIKLFFQRVGAKKAECLHGTIALCGNGGKVPLVISEDLNPRNLSERFRKVEYSVDKDAVRAALEAGEKLEFAWLGERGQSIRIR